MVARRCLLVALGLALPGAALAKTLTAVGHVSVEGGVIDDALALDDAGRTLAWIETTGAGSVRLHLDAVTGGHGPSVELTDFTVSPERILFVGGQWFVVANEGERRSAAVVVGKKIAAHIGPFGDALVSDLGGKRFVTVTERAGNDGRAFTIAAYRPGGGLVAQKRLLVDPEGELAGKGLGFIGFTNGYLQALVKKPGAYDRRSDARGPAQIAVYDVLGDRAGAGKALPDIPRFLDFAVKRNERPGAELFVRRNDDGQGLELVGPADKLRPLVLPEKLSAFAPAAAIAQQALGGHVVFAFVRDGITDDVQATGKKGPRALALFAVDATTAKVTALGDIPLAEGEEVAWAAGGSRIAVLRKTQPNAGTAIDVYQR